MVFNHHITIAHHSRCKSYVITYHAVVGYVAIDIGVEVFADTYIAREVHKGAKDRAVAQLNVV